MKKLRLLAAISLLFVGCMVSYQLGTRKHYNAACRMSDLIRCYEDMTSDSLFEELQGEFLDDVELRDYVYCY